MVVINVTGIPYVVNTGCVPVSDTSTTVAILPGPIVSVSSSIRYFCDTLIDSAILIGSVTNNVGSLTYQWYRNLSAISGAVDTSYTIRDRASYDLTVVAGNGCMATSNFFKEDTCGPSGGGCGVIAATASVACDTVYLSGTTYGGGTDYSWEVFGYSYSSNLDSSYAIVVYDTPGIYLFSYGYHSDSCGSLYKNISNTVGIVASFLYQERCAAPGTDSIILYDHTSFLPTWTIDTVYWFKGATFIGTGSNISLVVPASHSDTITQVVHYLGPDGYGTCQSSRIIIIPAPPVAIDSGDFIFGPYCEGVNSLFVSYGDPGGINKYYWDFGDGSSSLRSVVQKTYTWRPPANPAPFPVTLTVEDTLGCFASITDTVWIWHNTLKGNLGPNQTVCSNDAPVILSWVNLGADVPNRFTWSNGVSNQTGLDTITQSGAYWVNVSDTATSCQKVQPLIDVQVTIVPMPMAQFMGLQNYCIGDSIQLYSDAGRGVALQWYRNDTTDGILPTINDRGLPVGVYDYQLIASVTEADSTCADTSAVDTTHMYGLPPAPVITGPVTLDCSTYLLQLTATEPMDGQYNWSNGAHGAVDSIHSGGPYRVWFTDLQGCINHVDTYVPQSVDAFFAYFPTGCYTLCTQQLPLTLYGPPGDTLSYWAWLDNGDTISSGSNSIMPPLTLDSSGNYFWYLSNGGCGLFSDTMNVTAYDCPQCPPEPMTVTLTCLSDTPANYQMTISSTNPFSAPSTYTIGTNIGPVDPFSGTVGGGPYTLGPLTFTSLYITSPLPDSVTIEISFTSADGMLCVQQTTVHLDSCGWTVAERQNGDSVKHIQATISSAMTVFPNPTSGEVTISYNYGTNQYSEHDIAVYDEMGRKVKYLIPPDVTGSWNLNTNDWSPGIYIIRMDADGKALQTQRMVVVGK